MACNGMRRRVLGLCLGLGLGLGLAGLLPQGAAAETLTRPAAGIGDWIVMAGRLQLQPDGWFVATSGGQRAPFSSGSFLFNDPVESPYVLTVTARRPDNRKRPVKAAVPRVQDLQGRFRLRPEPLPVSSATAAIRRRV